MIPTVVEEIAATILEGGDPALLEPSTPSPAEREAAAVARFLYRWRHSPNTLRRYQTELSRLWIWAADRSKLISELDHQDFESYQDFLSDPQPRDRWCSARRHPRDSSDWRPFVKGLSSSSIQHAFNAIKALITVWLRSGYIQSDPMANKAPIRHTLADKVNQPGDSSVPSEDRWFDSQMSQAIRDSIEEMPEESPAESEKKQQYGLIIRTLTVTGARVSELTGAVQSQIYEDRSGWWIKLRGKGGKIRTVPLSGDYITETLIPWRIDHELPATPDHDEVTPLFPPRGWRAGRKGISSRMTLNIVKEVTQSAANRLPEEARRASALMRKASNHWFRHTFITSLIDNNIPTKTIMTTVGQNSEKTLRIYDHKQDRDRHHDITRVSATL